jgi:hypothetical protein
LIAGAIAFYDLSMSLIVALYDANVLYPAPLRDLFMWLAHLDLVQAKWSDAIHEEWIRNVLADRTDLTREQLNRTRDMMNRHAGECLVTGYEDLIPELTGINEGDRHVVAAAIRGQAEVIVTRNLKHFPEAVLTQYELEAQSPDDFVVGLLGLDEDRVCEAVRRQRANLKKPPKTAGELLETLLNNGLVRTVEQLQTRAADL